jgi:hypothetical protein
MPYEIKPLAWEGDWKESRALGVLGVEVAVTANHGGAQPVMSYGWRIGFYEDCDESVTIESGHLPRPVVLEQAQSAAESAYRALVAEHLEVVK